MRTGGVALVLVAAVIATAAVEPQSRSLPASPLGIDVSLAALPSPPTAARVRLGRLLFYDVRLSADHTVACATCHQPQYAFSVPSAFGIGIRQQPTTRKPPALINLVAALYPSMFRDGRARDLEDQALQPIANPAEMGNTVAGAVRTIRAIHGYIRFFTDAFGSPDVSGGRIARAIADYERTRMSGNSPWDRWRRNHDESAVSDDVKRGHELFFGKAGCNQCHFGSTFSDASFHNLGVGWDPKARVYSDDGRYAITKQLSDVGAFKTPTLRDVTKHPPYMHDGSIATLRDVIALYNRGGNANPHLDARLRPLHLAETEIADLVAFLGALDGEGYADVAPVMFPQ